MNASFTPRRSCPTIRSRVAIALLVALAGLAGPSALATEARAQEPDPSSGSVRPGAARPGPYLAVDIGGAAYDLDDEVVERFASSGVDFGDDLSGGGIAVGYSWRNEFALELRIGGGRVPDGQADVEAFLAQVDLAVRAPLRPRARVAPYLEGHLGIGALGVEGDGVEERTVFGGETGLGGGVEIHLSRRWALDFGYRFSLIDFEKESFVVEGDRTREVDFEGTGRVHRWALRTTFSF